MREFTVQSSQSEQLIDISQQVTDLVGSWDCSAVVVYVQHTTAGLLINEHADPDVARDILTALDRMVPADGIYRHAEGNAAAHVKASLVGTSQVIPLAGHRPGLGQWQGIFLAEFDGPRRRTVVVCPLGSSTNSSTS